MSQPVALPQVANQKQIVSVTGSITPASCNPWVATPQSFTVAGLDPIAYQFVAIGQFAWTAGAQSQTSGIVVQGAFVSAANTLTIVFNNTTSGALTPVAGNYSYTIL